MFLYASCWILTRQDKTRANHRTEYYNIFNTNKKFQLSHVMSRKNFLPGHNLRHETKEIIIKKRDFDLFFPESIPMEEKYKLFEDSMFHIAIENTRNVNYISEKIIDCFATGTIPIYWGCPSIKDFFDINGIITFNNIDELKDIIKTLDIELYRSKIQHILNNFDLCRKYMVCDNLIYEYTKNN